MKKLCLLFALAGACFWIWAQPVNPIPEISSLVSLINADTLTAHVQHLQNYQTRHALAGNQLEIATWISNQFNSYGFTNTYMQEYPHQGTTQYNVIATIPGYLYPQRYIVVSGHYDSQSLNSSNWVWAPGADDNATGTAGILEMARVMKLTGYQPRCSIRFIAFSAEEGMGYGSSAYCDYALSENQDIRISINLDMIASNEPASNEFSVVPFTGSPLHCQETITYSEPYTTLQPVEGPIDYGGDGMMFDAAGYPSVMFIESVLSPYWHSGEDVIEHLDFQYALQIMRAATASTAIFANQPVPLAGIDVFDTGNGSSLLVQWESSADPEVNQYAVYCGTETESMAFYQNVSGTQCLISGLLEGQNYQIAVASVNSAGYYSIRAISSGTPLSVPRTPHLLADFPNTGSITITWTPNTEQDLANYSVFRSLGSTGSLALIGTVAASEASFTDTDVSSSLEYYHYRIRANDTQGQQSQLSEELTSRLVSLDRGIYVIDESKNFGGTSPFQPTDQAVDDYYAGLLETFENVHHLDLEEYTGTLRLADIGIYSSILWHGNDNADFIYPNALQDVFRQYIQCGGQILFSLYFPSKAFELNSGYPAAFLPDSFISETMGIAGADYSVAARFKCAIPALAEYPVLQVDSLKTLSSWHGHLYGVETIEPVNPNESIYSYGSDYPTDSPQGVLNGQSVGVLHQYGAGKAVTLSFPLYNMQESASGALLVHVFSSLFNESTDASDHTSPQVTDFALLPNYPNPFRGFTAFRVETKDPHQPLSVSIYNLKGQLVRELYHGYPKGSNQFEWDGRDAAGNPVGSGLYFIRVSQKGRAVSRKIVLFK